MLKFAIFSKYAPTPEQINLAKAKGADLVSINREFDGFKITPADVKPFGSFDGVVVVHPAAAMQLCEEYLIGIFQNRNDAGPGERRALTATSFRIWDQRVEA
jgi:hypothetical protein